MQTRFLNADANGIAAAGELLANGELVAIPTETVYGLAADALNGEAVANIFVAKGRPSDNPLIVHIADIADWAPLVTEISQQAKALAEAFWPGPLTIILPAAPCIPSEVTAGLSTVAVRFPSHPTARAVIGAAGCPLAAPSANRSGAPSPTTAQRVMEDMNGRIAAVLEGGDCEVGVESTVVDLSGERPRLLRPGGVTPEQLRAVLGDLVIDPAVTAQLEEGATAASPGMKYKHYAPKAKLTLVRANATAFATFVNGKAAENPVALCFDGEEHLLNGPHLTYGARADAAAQAHRVFDALRQLDDMGAAAVYVACPDANGVGLAVYNRLLRAAGFEVITLD